MKFSCEREALLRELTTIAKVVSAHNTLPVLENFLLEAKGEVIHLTATDLEITITSHFEAVVEEEGACTIPAKLFSQYIQLLPEKEHVHVSLDNGSLAVGSSQTKTSIKIIEAEEYPAIPSIDGLDTVEIPRKVLLRSLGQVIFAASSNTTRPVLSGVYFGFSEDEITLATTDSFRLSEQKIKLNTPYSGEKESLLIPAKTLYEVMRVCGREDLKADIISLTIGKNQVEWSCGHVTVSSRLIEGVFPNYTQIIPKEEETTCEVTVADLAQALKRCNLFAKENNYNVKFIFNETSELTITSDAMEIGQDESTIALNSFHGKALEIALNSEYVNQLLSHVSSPVVKMICNGPSKPVLCRDQEDTTFIHLIMPLRA